MIDFTWFTTFKQKKKKPAVKLSCLQVPNNKKKSFEYLSLYLVAIRIKIIYEMLKILHVILPKSLSSPIPTPFWLWACLIIHSCYSMITSNNNGSCTCSTATLFPKTTAVQCTVCLKIKVVQFRIVLETQKSLWPLHLKIN